jgi:hypothetical protein
VGWELLEISRSTLSNLEESASRVVAGQVAGLIALWTQLYTFEEALPRALGWASWSVLIVSIAWLGRLLTPRRLARFWERLRLEGQLIKVGAPMESEEEAQLIRDLGASLGAQIRHLRGGTHISIVLGILALGLAALGFVVDKGFYEA